MRTREAQTLTDIILAIFRANGLLIAGGDRLSAPLDLTSARWQVLGAIALSGLVQTAPQIGEQMGMTRQGAQKQINRLEEDGLIAAVANPRHKRSPLYRLTEAGTAIYQRIDALHTGWANALADGLDPEALQTTLECLRALHARLETIDPTQGAGK